MVPDWVETQHVIHCSSPLFPGASIKSHILVIEMWAVWGRTMTQYNSEMHSAKRPALNRWLHIDQREVRRGRNGCWTRALLLPDLGMRNTDSASAAVWASWGIWAVCRHSRQSGMIGSGLGSAPSPQSTPRCLQPQHAGCSRRHTDECSEHLHGDTLMFCLFFPFLFIGHGTMTVHLKFKTVSFNLR